MHVQSYLPQAPADQQQDTGKAFKRLQNGSDIRGVALEGT